MFQKLTDFIERMDNEEHGTWVINRENDGSPEHPIRCHDNISTLDWCD